MINPFKNTNKKTNSSNRNQYIQINNTENTEFESVTCGVLQGTILGPLLFLLFVTNLKYSSGLIDSIMFPDDTIFFK